MTDNLQYSVLIVEDDRGNRQSLEKIFIREGFSVETAGNGKEGLEKFRRSPTDIVLSDLMMPALDGLELLKVIKTISPYTQVILITAYGTIDRAVEAIKLGAYDFITKPFKRRELIRIVQRALSTSVLVRENIRLKRKIESLENPDIIGSSKPWRRVMELVRLVAASNASVLIQGESGTGKELIAREIHRLSSRSGGPFVAVNCGAFPETLFDSEMFGYQKGAFTGALSSKPGRLELADGGTLFLDEISELSLSLQVKLLRVLQDRRVERLGATGGRTVDFRLISATNRDLQREVKAGNFRSDLLYRLNVIKIEVPPLRARPDDIPLLAQHFLNRSASQLGKDNLYLTPETLELLSKYHWPGNVRELENVMERAAVLSPGPAITPNDLPPEIGHSYLQGSYFVIPFATPLEQIEEMVIKETLLRCDGDKKLAAQLLGIATRTIYRKLELFNQNRSDGIHAEKVPNSPIKSENTPVKREELPENISSIEKSKDSGD